MLINGEGVIAYLGHPEKINLKDSVENLCKGEPLALDQKLLDQDNYLAAPKPLAAMAEACEVETGTFSEDVQLPLVREEMQKVSFSLQGLLAADPILKAASQELMTDHLMILRQTKVDPETDKLLTKYVNVNSLVGAEPAVKQIFLTLDPFLKQFNFTKEWSMSVTTN